MKRWTRRGWAALVAGSAARLASAQSQAAEPKPELRRALDALERVKLPRITAPAFRYDPR
jgi:hypothetical protein